MRDVETEVAGEFVCNECGRNSYFCWTKMSMSDIAATVTDSDSSDYSEESEVEEEDEEDEGEGFIYTEPSKVRCDHCGKIYEVCNDPDSEHTTQHKIETTETFQAAEFVCKDCNELNHFSLVAPNDHQSESESESDTWVMYPIKVRCKKCSAEFRPVSAIEEPEED